MRKSCGLHADREGFVGGKQRPLFLNFLCRLRFVYNHRTFTIFLPLVFSRFYTGYFFHFPSFMDWFSPLYTGPIKTITIYI